MGEFPLKLSEYNAANKAWLPFFNIHIYTQSTGNSKCVDMATQNPINPLTAKNNSTNQVFLIV